MTVEAWATAPENRPPDLVPATVRSEHVDLGGELCRDETCVQCRTLEVGARTLASLAGVPWGQFTATERGHYAAIVGEVYAAMSEKLIALGAVTLTDDEADAVVVEP